MQTRLAAAAIWAALAGAVCAQNAVTVPPSGDVRVSIYEGGQALFAEHRRATVAAGVSELQFTGLPGGITDVPLDLQVLKGPALRLLDQRVSPAAERPGKALSALIGQAIRVVRHGPGSDQVTEGKLLNVTPNGAVAALQVGDRVVLDPDGEVEVTPEQLAALTRSTTLICHVQSEAPGEAELLMSYLVGGAGWEAQHAILLSEDASTMSLTSWAMARIPSAAGMTAVVRLVAGSFAGAARALVYDLDRQASFGPGGEARLTMVEAPKVPVTNLLLFDGGALDQLATEHPVAGLVVRVTRFEVTPESGVGAYVPAGKATVYQKASQPGVQLISRTTMPAATKGATVDLALGEAAGMSAVSKQTSWRQLSPEDVERKCEMVIARPPASPAATVTCGATLRGKWKIADATHAYVVRQGDRVEFTVPMAAGETTATLSYTVRLQVLTSGEAKGGETAPPAPAPAKGAKQEPGPRAQ